MIDIRYNYAEVIQFSICFVRKTKSTAVAVKILAPQDCGNFTSPRSGAVFSRGLPAGFILKETNFCVRASTS